MEQQQHEPTLTSIQQRTVANPGGQGFVINPSTGARGPEIPLPAGTVVLVSSNCLSGNTVLEGSLLWVGGTTGQPGRLTENSASLPLNIITPE